MRRGAGGPDACERVPLSMADRYRLMQLTVNDRVCSGKSAIHGLGVFAKRDHKAGERWHLTDPVNA